MASFIAALSILPFIGIVIGGPVLLVRELRRNAKKYAPESAGFITGFATILIVCAYLGAGAGFFFGSRTVPMDSVWVVLSPCIGLLLGLATAFPMARLMLRRPAPVPNLTALRRIVRELRLDDGTRDRFIERIGRMTDAEAKDLLVETDPLRKSADEAQRCYVDRLDSALSVP